MNRKVPITKEAPPVSKRPLCPGRSKPLKPFYTHTLDGRFSVTSKEWNGTYQGYDEFCMLRCAQKYASFMFKKHGTMLVVLVQKQVKP